jgi:hypothetical protein
MVFMQWIALGEHGSIPEVCALVRDSFDLVIGQPDNFNAWDVAFSRFRQLVEI